MKNTKVLLTIAISSLVLMVVFALTMSIIAIRTANKRPSLDHIVIQSHDIEFCDDIYFAGERVPLEMFNI